MIRFDEGSAKQNPTKGINDLIGRHVKIITESVGSKITAIEFNEKGLTRQEIDTIKSYIQTNHSSLSLRKQS